MTALAYITRDNLKAELSVGTATTTYDDLLDRYVTATNEWIEHETWRPIGPTTGGTATFDAVHDVQDGALYVNTGVRSISSLTVAPSTGETGVAATVADLVILPRMQDRRPGWPGFWIVFKDVVTGVVSDFGSGYGNIVLVHDGGWAAIPAELSDLGYRVAVRAWSARNAGQQDMLGSDETGTPIVSRFASTMDWKILKSFRPAGGVTVG